MAIYDAARSDLHAAKRAIAAGASVGCRNAPKHKGPVHIAAREGQERIARHLLSMGAQVGKPF